MRLSTFFKGIILICFLLFIPSLCTAADSDIIFSTYFGGSTNDAGRDIEVDKDGNIYVIVEACSSDFPLKNPIQPYYAGGISDVIIAKFTPDGQLIFSTFIGGSGLDNPFGLAVDNDGNAYVTGLTTSPNFPVVNPIQYYNGAWDAFIFKISADGSQLYFSTYLGSSSIDIAYGIDVDSQFNVYVTGYTWSPSFPTVNPIQPSLKGSNDVFVTKIDPSGSQILFSTFLGGQNSFPTSSQCEDWGYDIATDNNGNVYVLGPTRSYDFPLKNPYQNSLGGSHDAFIAKINTLSPELVYSTFLGGSEREWPSKIEVHSDGTAYVTGGTSSNNFPLKNPLFSSQKSGFVARIDSSGSGLVFSTYFDTGGDIKIDRNGHAYLGGGLSVEKIKYDGSELLFSETLDGGAYAGGLAIDSKYNASLCGIVYWDGYIPIVNAYQPNPGGGHASDAFVVKISTLVKLEVEIDIKPNSDPNVINLKSKGNIPVAIFSTNEFNAATVDPSTISMAKAPIITKKNGMPMASFEDVNGDGLKDMVVHFDTTYLELDVEDTEAVLEGMTYDGIFIWGADSVIIIK